MTSAVLLLWTVGTVALWRRVVVVHRDPYALLSPVTLVVAGFFWIYVVGYWTLDPITQERYLSAPGYTKVLLLSLLSAAAFWLANARSRTSVQRSSNPGPRLAVVLGALLIIAGTLVWGYFLRISGGFFEYYGSLHGGAGAWKETSAYVYGTIYLLFSGTVVLVWVHAQRRLGFGGRVLLIAVVAFLLFDAWVTGSRGHLLRLALLVSIYVLFWRQGKPPSRLIPGMLLILMPILFVAVPFMRSVSHLGAEGSIAEALTLTLEMLSGLSESGPGHELVFAAGLVQAAWEQQAFDCGYLWLHPIVNLVPRSWWPDKPYAAEFSIDDHVLLWQTFGWVPTDGAAPTGLADSFVRFSWLSPLVWGVFGWVGGRFFSRARVHRDLASVSYLFCYLVGLTYLLTQGFNGALYASMFMAVPLSLCFAVARRLPDARVRLRYRPWDRFDPATPVKTVAQGGTGV